MTLKQKDPTRVAIKHVSLLILVNIYVYIVFFLKITLLPFTSFSSRYFCLVNDFGPMQSAIF